jgi:hypothetical protein
MNEAKEFFKKYKKDMVAGLNTCMLGQIERFDPAAMSADVTLLPDGDLIIDVPVGIQQTEDFYIRVPYQVGDIVLVVFVQRDIDGIMRGGDATTSQRMLSMDDAVVVCGINLYTDDPLPASNPGDLVIGKKNGNSKIVLNAANDDIEVTCTNFKVNGRAL